MLLTYRKPKTQFGGLWHFNPSCSLWPKVDYIQVSIPPVEKRRICIECMTHESGRRKINRQQDTLDNDNKVDFSKRTRFSLPIDDSQ